MQPVMPQAQPQQPMYGQPMPGMYDQSGMGYDPMMMQVWACLCDQGCWIGSPGADERALRTSTICVFVCSCISQGPL